MPSLVEQLQADALDRTVPAADLLRKAKVVAVKLDLADFLTWVERELNGYGDTDPIPDYRVVNGQLKALNPFRGWQLIAFPSSELQEAVTKRKIGISIGHLDDLLAAHRGNQALHMPLSADAHRAIVRAIEYETEVTLFIDRSQIAAIVDAVRNKILDWSLKLEKLGIVGDGMSFSKQEKAKAQEAASIVISNIENFVGNVGGTLSEHASISATQTNVTATIDLGKLRDFIAQTKKYLDGLPKEMTEPVSQELRTLDAEAKSQTPDQSKIKAALRSIGRIVEGAAGGAAGNLVASGIVSQINAFLLPG